MKLTVKNKIVNYSKTTEWFVVFRSELNCFGGQRQISSALKQLIAEGFFIKIGHGLYAKAKFSMLSATVITQKPLPKLAREVLGRLGIKTIPTLFEELYTTGKSNQVPTGRLIGIKNRTTRKIGFDGCFISYDYKK